MIRYNYKKMTDTQINKILKKNNKCILSMINKNIPYALPMYYEINTDCENDIVLELYSKNDSRKIEYLNDNDNVCISIVKQIFRKNYSINAIGKIYLEDFKNNIIKIVISIKKIEGRIYYS